MLTSCNTNDYSITICKKEPIATFANESETILTIEILVYHQDGLVKKTEMVEEAILKNGNMRDLELYSAGVEETFNNEVFSINGFNYSAELTDTSFIFTTTYDYTKIDIKQVLEHGKELFHVKDVVDENYEIPYDTLIKTFTELGFVCKKPNND